MQTRGFLALHVFLVFVLVASIVVYSGMGYMPIPPSHVFDIVLKTVVGASEKAKEFYGKEWYIVIQVRLPRIIGSAIVGSVLSMCGVVFQGVLLNPLADPYTLGISAGASFGAALAIVFDLEKYAGFSIQFMAFLVSIITLIIVIRMATFKGRVSGTSLILSGVIATAFFSAGLSLLKYLSGEEVGSIISWLMGSFASIGWSDVLILFIFAVLAFVVFIFYGKALNLLSLGDRSACALGIDPSRVRILLLVSASMATAATVSVTGIIGFVGIIVPHTFRLFVGADNRRLVILSAIGGAIFLSSVDNVIRAQLPIEVPIGVVTGLIGGPFFAVVFRRRLYEGGYGKSS